MNSQTITIGAKLGHGGQATVFEGKYGGQKVAVKKYQCNNRQSFETEVVCLQKLRHPAVATMLGSFTDEHSFIVMELYMGDWKSVNLNHSDACRVSLQLLSAVCYMHSRKFLHCDIKPQNCLIDLHRNCKLADFGFAAKMDRNGEFKAQTLSYSPGYGSLDLIRTRVYSFATDVFAIGATIYYGLMRQHLFKANSNETPMEIQINIYKGIRTLYPKLNDKGQMKWSFKLLDGIYERTPTAMRLKDLGPIGFMIQDMTHINASARPSCQYLLDHNSLYRQCGLSPATIFKAPSIPSGSSDIAENPVEPANALNNETDPTLIFHLSMDSHQGHPIHSNPSPHLQSNDPEKADSPMQAQKPMTESQEK